MRILSRFEYEGRTCYNLEDDGFALVATERGLYEEENIRGLTESGYKFCDYYGEIYTPEGSRIQELPLVVCTALANELVDMITVEESLCLPEAAATKYFARNYKINEIELRKPKEVYIKSREELLAYINKEKFRPRALRNMLPLNSFVAKEALFTIEEVLSDEHAREALHDLEDLRVLNGMTAVRELESFLMNEGLLKPGYKVIDFIKAYLSWGICGINARVTNIYIKDDICANIYSLNDDDESVSSDKLFGMVEDRCIYDKDGNIYSRFGKANWSEEDNVSKSAIRPVSGDPKEYFSELRNSRNWDVKYKSMNTLARRVSPRLYIELIAENGVRMTAKFDAAMFSIVTAVEVLYSGRFLSIESLYGDVLPFEHICNSQDYMLYNLCFAYAADVVKKKKVKVPVKSTMEMLKKEGLYAASAVKYIAMMLQADPANASLSNDIALMADAYRLGPDESMISTFNPNDLPYSNISELIAIMAETRNDMVENDLYPFYNRKDAVHGYAFDSMCRNFEKPVELFELVDDAIYGDAAFGNMGVGRMVDNTLNVESVAEMLTVLVKKELEGHEISYSAVQGVLNGIARNKLLNMDEVVASMSSEYYGYLEDKAELNNTRASTAEKYIWVTKVFREVSNQEASEQRHYMFECICYPLKGCDIETTAKNALVEAVRLAIREQLKVSLRHKEILLEEAPDFAAKLLFKIILKQANYAHLGADVIFTETVNIGSGKTQDLRIKVNRQDISNLFDVDYTGDYFRKYCTLYDYQLYEVNGSKFVYYCVNAGISPWYVVPKPWATISSYNFPINFFKQTSLQGVLSPTLFERIIKEKLKVSTIDGTEASHDLVDDDVLKYPAIKKYTVDTVGTTLAMDGEELIANYKDRWVMFKNYAKSNGKMLIRMPLKSDLIYGNYAEESDNICTDCVYEDVINGVKNSYWMTKVDRLTLSSSDDGKKLLSSGNAYKRFKLQDYSYEDVERWKDLVCGTFEPGAICTVSGPSVMITTEKGSVTIDLRVVTKREMEILVEKGIAYQLNATKYLILANSMYEVEVL